VPRWTQKFSEYFDNASVFMIPVECSQWTSSLHTKAPEADYLGRSGGDDTADTHHAACLGDILVFPHWTGRNRDHPAEILMLRTKGLGHVRLLIYLLHTAQ
jgi:hypothetical protein